MRMLLLGLAAVVIACLITTYANATTLDGLRADSASTATVTVGACLDGDAKVDLQWPGPAAFGTGATPTFLLPTLRVSGYGTGCRMHRYAVTITNAAATVTFQAGDSIPDAAGFDIPLWGLPATSVRRVTLVFYR